MAFPLIRFNGNEYEWKKKGYFSKRIWYKTDIDGRMAVEQYANALPSPFLPDAMPSLS